MSKTDELLKKFEDHIQSVEKKQKRVEETGVAIQKSEFQRDVAIGIELYQQYIDILDETKEEIEFGEI